jgi:replicative DNA helicase
MEGRTVLFCSLEMPTEELTMRLISSRTPIPVSVQRSSRALTPDQTHAIVEASQAIKELKLTISDTSGVDVHHIKSMARKHYRRHGHFLLIVDYLGLIATNHKIQNKVHQIEEITIAMKWLAKELNIPILLLAQLSRALEQRTDKRPMLSDLRDSGSIEQDADVVMFVYRDAVYAQKDNKRHFLKKLSPQAIASTGLDISIDKNTAEIVIGKNRQGEIGTVHLRFDGVQQRFYDGDGL